MQHSPLARGHGSEPERLACILNLIDSVFCSVAQRAGAFRLEAVGVERYAIMLFRLQRQDLRRDMFQCSQNFSVMIRQQLGVGAFAFDVDIAALKSIRIGRASACCNTKFESKAAGCGQQLHQ